MKIRLTATHDNALQLVKLFEVKGINYKLDLPDFNMVGFELDLNEVDFKAPKRFADATGITSADNTGKLRTVTSKTTTHTLDEVLEQAAGLADSLAGALTEILKDDPDLKDLAGDITIELQKLGFLK